MTTLEYRADPAHPERRLPALKRKTATVVQNKALIVALFPDWCEIRQERTRKPFVITWRKIYEVAAKLQADKVRAERNEKKLKRKSSVFR